MAIDASCDQIVPNAFQRHVGKARSVDLGGNVLHQLVIGEYLQGRVVISVPGQEKVLARYVRVMEKEHQKVAFGPFLSACRG